MPKTGLLIRKDFWKMGALHCAVKSYSLRQGCQYIMLTTNEDLNMLELAVNQIVPRGVSFV